VTALVVTLGVVLVVALAGLGGVVLRQRQLDADRVCLRLRFPVDLAEEAPIHFWRGVSGFTRPAVGRPSLVGETTMQQEVISHRLLVPRALLDNVTAQLAVALPDVEWDVENVTTKTGNFTSNDEEVPGITASGTHAVELGLSSSRPLRTAEPAALVAALLAALQPVAKNEQLIVQLVVAPVASAAVPRSGPVRPSVGPWWLRLGLVLVRPPKCETDRLSLAREKTSEPLFDLVLRVGVRAGHSARQRQLQRRVVAGLQGLRTPGVSFRTRPRPSELVWRNLILRRTPLTWPARVNARELSVLVAWPVKGVRAPGLALLRGRRLPVPASVARTGRLIGDSVKPARPVALSAADSLMHLLVQGATGSGKSTLLANLAASDMAAADGRALILLEPKGDLVRDLLGLVPPHRQGDVIVLDPADPEVSVGYNPLAGVNPTNRELVVDGIFSVLRASYASSWGPRLADLLLAGLTTLSYAEEPTLVELSLLYRDVDLRRQLLARAGEDAWTVRPVWSWFDGLTPAEQAAATAPLLNKLRPWTTRARVRQLLGVATPRWSFEEVLSGGKILLVTLGAGTLGRETANLLGALLVDGLWRATTARGAVPAEQRPLAMAYLDEFGEYARLPIDLGDALRMARGYRLGLTLASQSPQALPGDLRAAALSQARSKIVLQVGAQDAAVLARELGEPVRPEDLQGLGRFEGVAQLVADRQTTAPFSFTTRPLLRPSSASEAVRRASDARYGFDRSEVEQALRERHSPQPPQGEVGRRRRP